MNYMPKIAEMLGLENGDKFIASYDLAYKVIMQYTCEDIKLVSNNDYYSEDEIIHDIIFGSAEIIKMPWKPTEGDEYWYCYADGEVAKSPFSYRNPYELAMWKSGLCFKTKEEAKTKGKEIMEQIIKEYQKQ